MKKGYAVLFPGQGSQYVGMCRDLYEDSGAVRDLFSLGTDVTGIDVGELCFNGPIETLTQTANCQVALYAADCACWTWFSERYPARPACAAGHSLGEYAALTAAGALSPRDGFSLVAKRARLMQEAARSTPGTMLAVLGKSDGEVEALAAGVPGVEVSNFNSAGQVVVGGPGAAVAAFAAVLKEQGIRAVPLAVSGAFHTSLMRSAQEALLPELEKTVFSPPAFPVYANCTGEPVTGPSEIRAALGRQIVEPVRWVRILRAFSTAGPAALVELGPKNVLCGLARRTVPEMQALGGETIESIRAVMDVLSKG